jgi:glucokinase
MRDALLLGLDVGGLKSTVVLGDRFGNVLARQEFPTTTPEQTIDRMLRAAKSMSLGVPTSAGDGPPSAPPSIRVPRIGGADSGNAITWQPHDAPTLSTGCGPPPPIGSTPSTDAGTGLRQTPIACGIACGGPLNSLEGMILSPPNLPGWDFVPIVKHVTEELKIPAVLENDANAGALAEWRWGLGQRIDDLVYLTCGIGQGAGIVLDGRLHRGRQDLAGEIGHVRLLSLGPVGYHKAGSVEGLTSTRGLGELARLRLQEHHQASILDKATLHAIDGSAVADAALAGDHFATSVVKESACYLGRTCAILIDLLNPQRISLGGLALHLGRIYVDEVRRCAREEALSGAFDACDIDAAALGASSKDLAALAVASLAADEAAGQQILAAERARDHIDPLDVGIDFDNMPGVSTG